MRTRTVIALCLFTASLIFIPSSFGLDSGTVLKGGVNTEDYLTPNKGPSLNSGDFRNVQDAFGKGDSNLPAVGEAFQPPSDAFNLKTKQPAANPGQVPGLDQNAIATTPQPFNLSAQQEDSSQGQPLQAGKADPDNTPALQLAWDQWHKRVAQAIYENFNSMAQLAFRFSQPLACYVTYTVTRDGRIVNAQLVQKSPNVAFNALVLMVVCSMSGQTDVLAFPPGSQRNFVNKAGMFTQNYGVQGFKYTTGDKETVPAH